MAHFKNVWGKSKWLLPALQINPSGADHNRL